jgi:hypothetical protein
MPNLVAKLRERAANAVLATDQASATSGHVGPAADEESIVRAETILGRHLPGLLRDVYQQVGNGGFGPGYGLLRLLPDPRSSDVESVIGLYTSFCSTDPEDAAWSWPVDLVPFCDWGCAIRTCVDCSTPDGAIVTFDPGAREPGESVSKALAATHASVESWFADWLDGVKIWDRMFEADPSRAVTGVNPFTKEPIVFTATKLRRGGLTGD